jgi:hypothetical protein
VTNNELADGRSLIFLRKARIAAEREIRLAVFGRSALSGGSFGGLEDGAAIGYTSQMTNRRSHDQYSDEETERRATEALRRALTTPPKPQKEMVGKVGRAKQKRSARKVRSRKLIPRDEGSLAAIQTLGKLVIDRPDLADSIRKFLEVGAPLVRCEIDPDSAMATDDFIAVYKPSDRLGAFLAAMGAWDGDLDYPFEFTSMGRTLLKLARACPHEAVDR